MRIPWLCAALLAASVSHAQDALRQPPGFRLGDVATPLEYAATLAVDPREPRFRGEVRITLRFNRATPVLWLNATGLDIEGVEIEQGRRRIATRLLPGGEDLVGFEARGADFAPGAAVATIRYRGTLEQLSTRGLFRQQDRGEWYVVSQFEAIHARRAFPCFDQPGWKTPWQLTVDAPADQVVVSNTPEVRTLAAPGRAGWTRHEFAQTKPLPTYLVALAVGPFDVVDGGTAGGKKTQLRYFTPKGRAAEARYAKEATPKLLELLEDYFGMPYPFEKLDSVTIPQTVGFGAMENVGMITYAASILLATRREETVAFQRRYAAFAAHEIAHMWFGNLVTLAWWDDIWLNEAFATWMGNKTVARYRPEWDSGWSLGYSRKRALELDRLASARRVRNPVLEKTDLPGAFDSITYHKGGAVLDMFENWFSPERFRQGVRIFLKRHAWGTASSQDFVRALGEASGRSREALDVFRGFIEQPGVPLLDVALECTAQGASLGVVQSRLRPLGSEAPEMQWTTPACFRYGRTTRCSDIRNGAHRVAVPETCPAWVLANAGGKSHYVPRYESSLGKRLRHASIALSPNEMVSLTIDAGLLASSGLMSIGEALAWADAGLAHPSPIARLYAVDLLHKQRDAWLTPTQAVAKRELIARRIRPLAAELGWIERPEENDQLRDLRAALLPFAAETEDEASLRLDALWLAWAWLVNREAVPATMTRAVLDTAARFSDDELYARLEALARETLDLRERYYLLAALAKTRDDKLRSRALALVLQNDLNGRDARDFLESALEDDANRSATFAFLRANFDALVAKLPQHSAAQLMPPLAELCTPEERVAFAAFFKDRAGQFLGGPLRYRQTLERIDICLAARAR